MKNIRKCSTLLAASASAAVCLTGGHAFAASGTYGGKLMDKTGFHSFFSGKIHLAFSNTRLVALKSSVTQFLTVATGTIRVLGSGSTCKTLTAANVWFGSGFLPFVENKYIAIRFNDGGGFKYGWTEFTCNSAASCKLYSWSYNNTVGGAIKTLSESVTAKKLPLLDGRTKLVWSNTNEDGIARYEAQTKDASGVWTTVSSDAAGAGSYSATVPAGATYRIVVEKVDGATEEIGF